MEAMSLEMGPTGEPKAPYALRMEVASKTWPAVAGRSAHTVLRNVALEIDNRSFVVISGPSGCGKSTLLNIVAGLDQDYDGRITFGVPNPRLSFIFQSPRLLPWKTVEENIALVLPEGDPRRANVSELISRVGLAGAESAYPERLSLGMQRRVAIARGFVVEPDILLMDEPFVSLDDPTADALRALVLELWQRHPTTILFVTHDRREAVRLATRIVRLGVVSPAGNSSVVADLPVLLSTTDRLAPDKLALEQARVFGAV